MDTDPHENVLKFEMSKQDFFSMTLLFIGFRYFRDNYIKTRQYNKETNKFYNWTDPKD